MADIDWTHVYHLSKAQIDSMNLTIQFGIVLFLVLFGGALLVGLIMTILQKKKKPAVQSSNRLTLPRPPAPEFEWP